MCLVEAICARSSVCMFEVVSIECAGVCVVALQLSVRVGFDECCCVL